MNPVVTATARVSGKITAIPPHLLRDLRRADDFITMSVIACQTLLEKINSDTLQPESSGLIIGTAFGPMQTNFDVLEPILDDGQASPTLFSHSVYNAAAGYISRIFNIRGSSLTMTDFGYPFFHALRQASLFLASGVFSNCIILQVETYSRLLADAQIRSLVNFKKHWQPEAIAWLLETDAGPRSGYAVETLQIETHAAPAIHAIERREKMICGQREIQLQDPAAAAAHITQSLLKDLPSKLESSISGPFGSVQLVLCK